MLAELAEYAYKHRLASVPGFVAKSARWAIWLDEDGEFIDLLDLRGERGDRTFPQCPNLSQGELIANGVTRSHFILDNLGVVALYKIEAMKDSDCKKHREKHKCFLGLLEGASGVSENLGVCAKFLESEDNLRMVQERLAAAQVKPVAKPTDKITFRVGDDYPVDIPDWHNWWNEFRAQIKGNNSAQSDQRHMRCLQTGEQVSPLRTHPKIMGLKGVGGLATGCVLIGCDKDAFTSYGLEQSENAAVSEEAASVYADALNDLVKKAGQPIAGVLPIHWFKETVAEKDDPMNWLTDVLGNTNESDELTATQRAKKILDSLKKGERPDLGRNVFHAALISASGGRVIVRDWQSGTFAQLVQNIDCWFEDLAINALNGTRLARTPGLFALLFSLVREKLTELAPSLITGVWQSAVFGRLIPRSVVVAALQRIRVEVIDPKKMPSPARMGMIKAYLVREARCRGGEDDLKPYLNKEHPSLAYQAGRLMAVLAAIQRAALPGVEAGIVQRYYAAASTTPALILGRLIRQSQFHLGKLDRGLSIWYEGIVAEIMGRLGDGFPVTLDLEGQSLFALGYYQQMATMYQRKEGEKPDQETEMEAEEASGGIGQ